MLILMRMFLKRKKSIFFCLASAAFGSGGYILLSFWGKLGFLKNILGFSLLIMVCAFIAYIPENFKELLRLWGLLYLFTFFIGGICSGIFYYTKAGAYIGENLKLGFKSITPKLFLLSVIFSYIVIKTGLKIYNSRIIKKRQFYSVSVSLKGKKAYFTALGDTGNTLKESTGGKTVLVAEYEAVKNVLPESGLLKEDIYGYIAKYGNEIKFSLVPYKSLGNRGGIIVCFQPDMIEIDGREYDSIIIGISFLTLSSDRSFRGLINTEALITEGVNVNVRKAA
ncbi:MAG: sigma-E processing peptidase SpoIIGA [Clostridiales bacterium]|nr:sigma-E processing peptidase SpoIIGA [Clostridiales bacterium]